MEKPLRSKRTGIEGKGSEPTFPEERTRRLAASQGEADNDCRTCGLPLLDHIRLVIGASDDRRHAYRPRNG